MSHPIDLRRPSQWWIKLTALMTRKKIISKLIWSNISSSIGCIIRCGCVCVVNLYFKFYIFQDIPVKLWNCWKWSKNLTNNGHEGYNGRLKRKIKAPHPNPNKLLCFLKKELALSELCARHYENGGDPPYTAKKYRVQCQTRWYSCYGDWLPISQSCYGDWLPVSQAHYGDWLPIFQHPLAWHFQLNQRFHSWKGV